MRHRMILWVMNNVVQASTTFDACTLKHGEYLVFVANVLEGKREEVKICSMFSRVLSPFISLGTKTDRLFDKFASSFFFFFFCVMILALSGLKRHV